MTTRNRILLFGAGFVSEPMVDYLLNHNFKVTVASRTLSKADKLINGHKNGKTVAFDITKDGNKLEDLINGSDLVVSLLPYAYHVKIAEIPQKVRILWKTTIRTFGRANEEKLKN